MKMVNCCGFRIPEWVHAIIAKADLSVRAASAVCRLYRDFPCGTQEELLSNLSELAAGRLVVLGCASARSQKSQKKFFSNYLPSFEKEG